MFKMSDLPDLCVENIKDFLTLKDCTLAELPYMSSIETLADKLTKKAHFDYLPIIVGMDVESDVKPISQGQYIKDKVKEFFAQDNQATKYQISDLKMLASLLADLDEEKYANLIRGFYFDASSDAQHKTFMAIGSIFKISHLLGNFLMQFAKFLKLDINAKNIFNVTVIDSFCHSIKKSYKNDLGTLKFLLFNGADKNYLPITEKDKLAGLLIEEEKENLANDKPKIF